jgi:hypothetical protein
MSSTNYYHTIPNSHFWTDVAQLRQYLVAQVDGKLSKRELIDFLLTGLNNCLSQGYNLHNLAEEVVPLEKEERLPTNITCALTGCLYSKTMNQSYPRLCIRCRLPEQTLKPSKPIPPPTKFITEGLPPERYNWSV